MGLEVDVIVVEFHLWVVSEKKPVKQAVLAEFDMVVTKQLEVLIETMPVERVVLERVTSEVISMKTVEFQWEEIVCFLLTGYSSASLRSLSLENFGCPHH